MSERSAAGVVQDLLDEVNRQLALDAEVEVVEEGEEVRGTLHGDDLGLFIGRHGQTIDAVQHLAARMLLHGLGERRRVVIDAEGYRGRREEALRRQADDAADEAIESGRPVALDAMTASERRVVHEYLRDRGDVETHSEGEEPDRHLVVGPRRGVAGRFTWNIRRARRFTWNASSA